MCNLTAIAAELIVAATAITTAIALVVAASAANAGFFSAPGSPALMIAASISSGVAAAALTAAYVSLSNCESWALSVCGEYYYNALNSIAALATVLAIQTVAAAAAAGVAWIPWGAQPAMLLILGSLVSQLALIPSATVFLNELMGCIARIEAIVDAAVSPLVYSILFGGPIIITTIVVTYVVPTLRTANDGESSDTDSDLI